MTDYGTMDAFEATEQEIGDVPMNTTITITFTDIEPGRVRASIPQDDLAWYGVYAEAADPQTAAAQVVKAYFAMQGPSNNTTTLPEPHIWPVRYYRDLIKRELEDAVTDQGAIRISYSDADGHETERVVHPSSINPDLGLVYAFDDLRGHVRSFRLDRIESAQRLS